MKRLELILLNLSLSGAIVAEGIAIVWRIDDSTKSLVNAGEYKGFARTASKKQSRSRRQANGSGKLVRTEIFY